MGNLELNTKAKSAEEPAMLAKENGIELTEGEAEEFFEMSDRSRELSDDELEKASGGCGRTLYYNCFSCKREFGWKNPVFEPGTNSRRVRCPYCNTVNTLYPPD